MSDKTAKALKEFSQCYDNNEYARGLKQANKFLKQHPEEAEAIAWKAIFLQFTKKPKDAVTTIAEALRKNMKNAKIWKLQGIIMREQSDYTKALQSFTMAYRLDSKDDNILLEICNLHLYERNKKLFLQNSYNLLSSSKSSSAVVRYAVALHLDGRTKNAIDWLNTYEINFMPPISEDETLFRNELFLYHSTLYIEAGMYDECIKYLEKNQPLIRDAVSVNEKLATCYVKLGKKEEALKAIRSLIDYYPENGDYFTLLQELLAPDEFMHELTELKGKSRYAQVRILELLDINDPNYRDFLKEYMVPYLVKGAPSLFTTLSELSLEKLEVAKEVADSAPTETDNFPITSIPIVKLFDASVFLAKDDLENALESVESAIKHTPTCLESRTLKLRILRKMGRIEEAMKTGQELAEYDPNDRNSSTLYTNAALRNGKLKTAYEASLPFSIDSEHNPRLLLTQYNDFHVRAADCAYRAKDYKQSTGFYNDVVRHFSDFRKSQYNYLSWGMRHVHALYDMLKWADELPKHKMLARGLLGLLKIHFLNKAENPIEKNKDLQNAALQATFSEDPAVLAYAAIYYSLMNEPLPCLKCLKKCQGPWKFAAIQAAEKVMSSLQKVESNGQKKKIPEIVKEVAQEAYKLEEGQIKANYAEAKSFLEKLALARGMFLVAQSEQETANAKQLLLDAVKSCEYNYKQALDAYTVANNEMNDAEFAKKIEDEIHVKHPQYQVVFEYEKGDLPKIDEEQLND